MTGTLMERARALGLHGLLVYWDELADRDWIARLTAWEEEERRARSLKRRLADARLERFKPLADFDWDWPRRRDRMAVEDLMSLDFLKEAANLILVGPNGVGKSTIATNIAHRAVLEGHIHVHQNNDGVTARRQEERDLVAKWNPNCNG